MQMMDGLHLSGDQWFKLTKCVVAGGSKPFTSMYCILNEFCQVNSWWFTTGTGMKELENSVKKITERYNKYGYDGPESATTDGCCQEISFWKRTLGLVEDLDEIDVNDASYEAQVALQP